MSKTCGAPLHSDDVKLSASLSTDAAAMSGVISENTVINVIGAKSYTELSDKPKIEGVTLEDDKSFEELGMSTLSNTDLESLLKL